MRPESNVRSVTGKKNFALSPTRYPTGDVVVSERDLAEQLRKHPDIVATLVDFATIPRNSSKSQ